MSTARRRPAKSPPSIDREKLRAALRRLRKASIFDILDTAIDQLSPTAVAQLVAPYLNVAELRPDSADSSSLVAEVRAFDLASRAGDYYEGFSVNSKNYMDKSEGTETFIVDCNRLLARCVAQTRSGDPLEVRESIELILGLIRHIDECHDDIVFFADEGGSWQVDVDWAKVLPALFRCLTRTAEPEEYARIVVEVVDEFDKHRRRPHYAEAQRLATAGQHEALRRRLAGRKL
jgi:hypothetical protein